MADKVAVGLSLPRDILEFIDQERGRLNRSAYVTVVLDKLLLKRRKPKDG